MSINIVTVSLWLFFMCAVAVVVMNIVEHRQRKRRHGRASKK